MLDKSFLILGMAISGVCAAFYLMGEMDEMTFRRRVRVVERIALSCLVLATVLIAYVFFCSS
jgi:hypothetical protein